MTRLKMKRHIKWLERRIKMLNEMLDETDSELKKKRNEEIEVYNTVINKEYFFFIDSCNCNTESLKNKLIEDSKLEMLRNIAKNSKCFKSFEDDKFIRFQLTVKKE